MYIDAGRRVRINVCKIITRNRDVGSTNKKKRVEDIVYTLDVEVEFVVSCECLSFTICYLTTCILYIYIFSAEYKRDGCIVHTNDRNGNRRISHVSKWRGPGRLMHKYVNNAQPRVFFIGSAGPGRWHLTYGRGFGRTGSMPCRM